MAINLLQNVQNAMNQISRGDGQVSSSSVAETASRQAIAQLKSEIMNLLPGSTLQGELVSQDGKAVQLLLNNTLLLNTQIDTNANLNVGSKLTFQVSSNQDGQLTLRPLFANMANSETVYNALNAAGIEATETTVNMVNSLMEQGMPVNKDMLQTINRELSMYPQADVNDIVMLHKMDIPVNQSTVTQMHLYNNNNQYILNNIETSAAELTDVLLESATEGGYKAASLINDMSELLVPGENNGEQLQEETAVAQNPETVTAENVNAAKTDANVISAKAAGEDPVINNLQSEESAKSEATAKTVTDQDINKNNVFEKLQTLDKDTLAKPEIKAHIKNAISDLLKDNMLMDPKDIGKESYVKKYYEKLSDLTDKMNQIMNEAGKADSSFARSLTGVRQNVDFMNQVNELYNYVQLPLKMAGEHANGDLYVYAKKRKANAGPDDNLTALLHLSMDHLGNMDIFLSLKEGKLNTKFCLEKEENIDLIAAHIDELNARLRKKGYNVTTSVGKADSMDESVIDNIVHEEKNILLSTQSFDARA